MAHFERDLWCIHPGVNTGTGSDRVRLDTLNLDLPGQAITNGWRGLAVAACRRWWPAIPAADLNDLTVEFSDRSSDDEPEVIVYLGGDREVARGKLSPTRAR
jgi:hypothetical protein